MKNIKSYKLFETHNQDVDMIALANIGLDGHVIDKIKQGADVNYQDAMGQTALIMTCYRSKRSSTIDFLLSNGADPNIQDRNGNTALHISTINYAESTVFNALIKGGANMKLKNKYGKLFISMNKSIFDDNYSIQKTIMKYDESMFQKLIINHITICDEIKKEYPHLITAAELNLL